MKKIKLLLIVCFVSFLALTVSTKISAATGNVTLYETYALYDVDNRPYAASLSMHCVYKYKDIRGDIVTKNQDIAGYGVYINNRIDAANHYISYYGSNAYYVNGFHEGTTSRYY